MTRKERSRLEVLSRVRDGQLKLPEAARLMGVSYRQAKRIKADYLRHGDAGLVHGLRGRAGNRKTDESARAAVLGAYRAKYAGFGPTLACEYLAKDGLVVSHDTLWRWLRAAGLFERRRRRGKHRARRTRRGCRGELVQMDGSWHDWFEGRGPWCCLMVLVDDATGETSCRFYERETLAAAFDVFGRYAAAHGLPRALYVDRAAMYEPDGDGSPTQFGRAMNELDVELICANSPQAKGRVERANGTLQDRLVKALRLADVGDIDAANRFLADSPFLAELNERFRVAAASDADLHRPVDASAKLGEVLCVHEARAVGRDWCVQWRGRLLQIDASHAALQLTRPGRRVTVVERPDGTLHVRWAGADLLWREVSRRPPRPRPAKPPVTNNKRYVPPADHPWKAARSCVSRRKGLVGSASSPLAAGRSEGDSSIATKRGTVLLR